MVAFLARRLLLGALVLVGLSLASFCFFAFQQEIPGQQYPSLLSQWWTWAKGLWGGPSLDVLTRPAPSRLNFSLQTTMLDALGHTALLLALTVLIVVLLAAGLALAAVAARGTALDLLLRILSYAAWAVPAFLLALLVQLVVFHLGGSRGIGPFPLAGWPGSCPTGVGVDAGILTPCPAAGTGIRYVGNVLRYTSLPALTLALGFVGLHGRYLRSALLEAIGQPYVTTARAKGLPERRVLVRHALRASLVTFAGALLADLGAILGSAMAVDYLFQLNGLGTVFVSEFPVDFGSIDTYSIVPLLLLTALLVLAASLLADVAVFWLDPRAREVE